MKWKIKDPKKGDMVRVLSNGIYHFGIFVAEDEVIQFGRAPDPGHPVADSQVRVLATDIDGFCGGAFLEVAEFGLIERMKNNSPEKTVALARARIGEGGYNIIYNNCEHFASECIRGRHYSSQSERVAKQWAERAVADLYIAQLPCEPQVGTVFCKARNDEISRMTNEGVRAEKYYVWKLLEYAIEKSFGIPAEGVTFTKSESGKWLSDSLYFSLSHSKSALAVAVSKKSIGVDIELLEGSRNARIYQRIMTPEEQEGYLTIPEDERVEFLIGAWTAKEAQFKAGSENVFEPRRISSSSPAVSTRRIRVGSADYMCSVCTEDIGALRVFDNINLE